MPVNCGNSKEFQKESVSENINMFFTLLVITWSFTPFLQRNAGNIIVLIIFLGWWLSKVFCKAQKNDEKAKSDFNLKFITIFWIAVVSAYVFVQLPNLSIGNYYYIILYYMPIFIFIHYVNYGKPSIIKKILRYTFLILLINAIINIMLLMQYPYAAKEITGGYGLIDFSGTNIVTDIFIFSFVLAVYAAIISARFLNNTYLKWIFRMFAVIVFIMIIQSTFFIAIISLFFLLILYILINGKTKLNFRIKLIIFSLFIALLLIFEKDILYSFYKWVASVTDNYIILQRVNSLCNMLMGLGTEGSLAARLNDIKISVSTFLEYPIFGKGYLMSKYINNTGIGMHSHVFDDLARFGIFGFIIEMSVYFIFASYVCKALNTNIRKYYRVSWLGFIFYACFNGIVYPPAGMMLFFVFPLTIYYLDISRGNAFLVCPRSESSCFYRIKE